MYNLLRTVVGENSFYNAKCDAVGCEPISLDILLIMSLKHLAFGVVTTAWQDYFQMGSTTSRKAVKELCFAVSTNLVL